MTNFKQIIGEALGHEPSQKTFVVIFKGRYRESTVILQHFNRIVHASTPENALVELSKNFDFIYPLHIQEIKSSQ